MASLSTCKGTPYQVYYDDDDDDDVVFMKCLFLLLMWLKY